MSSPKSKWSGYALAVVREEAVLMDPFLTCFCQNLNLLVHWQRPVKTGFHSVLFSVYVLARSYGMELAWPASNSRLPQYSPQE